MDHTDDFEQLMNDLNEQNGYSKIKPTNKIQKADKNASLFDFIKMINKMVDVSLKGVKFIPDEGTIINLDSLNKINAPIITYKVISREPKSELKPRYREQIINENDNEMIGEIWGQQFKCIIQFDIYASVYTKAEEVMTKFEDTFMMFIPFFKKNGVGNIIFKKQFTDDNFQNLRQSLSVRNLQYYVEIEKQTVIFNDKIKEINSLDY